MKVREWIRSSFVVATLSACISAQAAVLSTLPAEVDQSVVGDQTFDYSFTPTASGTITAILTDLVSPVAFDFLRFGINAGPTIITAPISPGTFSFTALANTVYSLTVFAGAGAIQGTSQTHFFGKYHLTVSAPAMSPVPEPGVWLMMLGGVGLLGWMRLRKSGSFR